MSHDPQSQSLLTDIHCSLGRALLRCQHLERMLKGLVVGRFVSMAPENVKADAHARKETVNGSTLGWLKEELLAKYLRIEGSAEDTRELDKAESKGHLAFRLNIQVPSEYHASLSQDLSIVLERRNQLVHHFLGNFDLQTSEGCEASLVYLNETHQLFDTHLGNIWEFAKCAYEGHQMMAAHLQSPEFQAVLHAKPPAPKKKRRKRKPAAP